MMPEGVKTQAEERKSLGPGAPGRNDRRIPLPVSFRLQGA